MSVDPLARYNELAVICGEQWFMGIWCLAEFFVDVPNTREVAVAPVVRAMGYGQVVSETEGLCSDK